MKEITESFKTALKRLLKKEAGWVNDPDDRGGETYKGIARNFYLQWEGWKIIDSIKKEIYFPENPSKKDIKKLNSILESDERVNEAVQKFYKEKYWDPMHGDELDPKIASKLFGFAVNSGTGKTAVKYLQRAMNYLNRNGKDFPDLVNDGIWGQKTKNAYNILKRQKVLDILLQVIKCLQCSHYLKLMDKNEKYEKYRGWFRRIDD